MHRSYNTSYQAHRGNSGQQWDRGRVVEGYWLLHSSISCFTQGQLLATWAAVVIPRWEISGANNFGWIFRMLLVGRLQVGRQAGQNCWREGKVWWWWIEDWKQGKTMTESYKMLCSSSKEELYHHWAPPTRWWSQSQGGAAVGPHDADGRWFRQKPDS